MNTHQHEHHHPDGDASGDPPGGHGMVVLGAGTVFLSHLPMFMAVHDYQVILEAEFVGPDGLPEEAYAVDRKDHPDQKLYTLAPRPFVLPDILPRDDKPPRLSSFRGNVFRNHFERKATDPEQIAQDVVVNVKNVVHGRKFDPAAERPKNLEYILFGRVGDIYLAHLISRPPDFDQLIRVTVDHELSDENLARGLPLSVPDRSNSSSERVREGDGAVSSNLRAPSGDIAVVIEPGVEFYLEEGELAEKM